MIAHILNHVSVTRAGVTLGVYMRHTYEVEVRAALDLWADRLAGILGGSTARVIPMQRQTGSCA